MYRPEHKRLVNGGYLIDPEGLALTLYDGERETRYSVRALQSGSDETGVWYEYNGDEQVPVYWFAAHDGKPISGAVLKGATGLKAAMREAANAYRP